MNTHLSRHVDNNIRTFNNIRRIFRNLKQLRIITSAASLWTNLKPNRKRYFTNVWPFWSRISYVGYGSSVCSEHINLLTCSAKPSNRRKEREKRAVSAGQMPRKINAYYIAFSREWVEIKTEVVLFFSFLLFLKHRIILYSVKLFYDCSRKRRCFKLDFTHTSRRYGVLVIDLLFRRVNKYYLAWRVREIIIFTRENVECLTLILFYVRFAKS